jgi:hypothetical protein
VFTSADARWSQQSHFTPVDIANSAYFGACVNAFGEELVVGATRDNTNKGKYKI